MISSSHLLAIDKSMISRHENEPSLRIVGAPVFQVPLKNGLPMSTRLTVRAQAHECDPINKPSVLLNVYTLSR